MKTIWVYELNFLCSGSIEMPTGAEIVKVNRADGQTRIWAMVTTTNTLEKRNFYIASTGEDIEWLNGKYIDTFFDGPYVWHLLERFI